MTARGFFYSIMAGKRQGVFSLIYKIALIVPSFIYILAFVLIKKIYTLGILKRYKATCKIISVGNITLGGTGKTPFVNMLAQGLLSFGRKPAILIRGYGNDEQTLLAENLPKDTPVLVGKDRIKNIKKNTYNTDTFILDDGFQHIKLFRDLDIVLIDATCPFGNGLALPAGTLREPISNLKRADMIVLTKIDFGRANLDIIKHKISQINPSATIFESVHRPLYFMDTVENKKIQPDTLKGKKTCLVSGIADNESFCMMVSQLGIEIKEKFFFPDHYRYTPKVMEKIFEKCARLSLDKIITTQKDYVKMKKVFGLQSSVFSHRVKILVLHIKLEIKDEQRQEFKRRILSIYPC